MSATVLSFSALGVLQVLAQQHAGPVAGLGSAGTRLDVDKAVARVFGLVEHAPEFKLGDHRLKLLRVDFDAQQAGLVTVGLRHVVELDVVAQVAGQVVDGLDHGFQRAFLATEFLRALGLVPDLRVLERGVDFVESQGFPVVVKDTP